MDWARSGVLEACGEITRLKVWLHQRHLREILDLFGRLLSFLRGHYVRLPIQLLKVFGDGLLTLGPLQAILFLQETHGAASKAKRRPLCLDRVVEEDAGIYYLDAER